jgi:putative protein-disulfide isomerase
VPIISSSILGLTVAVCVRYFTDPACSASWASESKLRRLMVEFGDSLSWSYVMGGLARDYTRDYEDRAAGIGGAVGVFQGLLNHWLDVAAHSGVPIDPRLWTEGPITSTYPACMATKAAFEQGPELGAAYLRALREGLLCFRRKLDTTEALVEEARGAGLNVERFRIDLGSHAIVEAFGADLDLTRAIPADAHERKGAKMGQGGERVVFPTLEFRGEDGASHHVYGRKPLEEFRAAALAAGATLTGEPAPSVTDALRRFRRMATKEIEVVCELPATIANAQLWQLAAEWRVRPISVLTGHLWELAD